jgi:hypothetical protein
VVEAERDTDGEDRRPAPERLEQRVAEPAKRSSSAKGATPAMTTKLAAYAPAWLDSQCFGRALFARAMEDAVDRADRHEDATKHGTASARRAATKYGAAARAGAVRARDRERRRDDHGEDDQLRDRGRPLVERVASGVPCAKRLAYATARSRDERDPGDEPPPHG